MLTDCTGKSPKPSTSLIPLSNAALLDSITKLDSLVGRTKASNNVQAHRYAKQALSIALRMNSEVALARAYLMLGIGYFNHNSDSSFIYYSMALTVANKYKLKSIKPKIFYNLANVYQTASDNKMALIFLDSSISLGQISNDHIILSNAYNALGNLKSELQDTVDAKAMYDSAYNIAHRNKLQTQMGIATASLARFENDPVSSFAIQQKAINLLQRQPGNEEEISLILINLGLQSINIDTAISYYRSAIKISQSGNSAIAEIAAYNNLAYSLLDKKNFQEAVLCLEKHAIPIAKRIENYDWLSTLYDTYTDVLLAENKIGQALTYERKALKARVEADKRQANAQVRLLAALLDLKNKELRIQTNARELEEKENKIHLMNAWFSIVIIFLLLTIFIVIWIMQRKKIRYQKEIIISAKRVIEAEESMKGRVSMELHDLTTPFYTSMLQQIEQAQISDNHIEYDLKSKLSLMTASLRKISHRMSNSFIEELTISELVNGLCEDLKIASIIPIHCVISQTDFNLSTEQTIHLYRIVQELLTNATKYVTSGEININLYEEAGMFFIFYQDTGPGFDMKTAISKGLGVMNIFERAKIINGNARLNTSSGKGTKWYISLRVSKVNHTIQKT